MDLRFLFFLTLLSVGLSTAWAQEGDKRRFAKVNLDSTGQRFHDRNNKYIFEFNNIHKPYHYDPAALKKLDKLEKQGELKEAKDLLEDYVAQFGIPNFYIDTDLLWRLGQLYERVGEVEKAKSLFRLTLKHHREVGPHSQMRNRFEFKHRDPKNIVLLYYDSIQNHYNQITEMERDYYIPLDYYYELVEYRMTIDTVIPPRNVLTNMGPEINSPYPDYAPSLATIDDTLYMFYSSRRKFREELSPIKNEDVYWSWNENDYWHPGQSADGMNTPYNEGSVLVYDNGQKMIFARCNAPGGYGNCDLYSATFNDTTQHWEQVRNMGPNVNGSAWESQPALSHTGDTLFFASDRLGGFGLSDIYYCTRTERGDWSKARNIGPTINTHGNEASPYYHPKFNVLYFASTGHIVNFGDFDIYKSYLRGNTYQEPRNVGPLVNGKGSEYYFTIDKASENLYYARSEHEDMHNLDLFSFPLPMGAQPEATTVFHGELRDKKGQVYEGIVSIIDLDEGVEVAPKALRPDGSFDFDLIKDRNYLLVIQGEDFFRIEKQLRLEGDTSINIQAKQVKKSSKITFEKVRFEPASSKIKESAYEDLEHVKDFLIDNPHYHLIISGHTDSRGDHKVNMKLSQERANAIKKFLSKDGAVAKDRIEAYGYGDTKPIVQEEITDEDRRKNRRVEFELVLPENEN